MSLAPGSRLGPYEIIAPAGAGGMGVVYRARDTRLDRTVAVKVLPPHLTADPQFRERFDREARSISALNHPHICVLHDVGVDGDVSYLVMEYLEGETLADRLKTGPLPVAQVLDIGLQIADALDKAHRRGIVHRDLKPGNIMLTKSGAKLLDFGLAKIHSEPGRDAQSSIGPTITATAPLTSQGSLVGTFQYMAPEQLEGRDVDARTDIWALGCVLYETATGARAFEAPSQASLIAAILEREPRPMSELQPVAPPALDRAVRTCLAKSPDDRFQSAHDVWLQLKWIAEGGSAAGLPAPVVAKRRRREHALWAGLAALLALAGAALAWTLKPAPTETHTTGRFLYPLPAGQTFTRTGRHIVGIASDGSAFAYVANRQLFLRRVNLLDAVPIRGTEEDPLDLVFSPDGRYIAYFSVDTSRLGRGRFLLRRIAVTGGSPFTLCANLSVPFGITWSDGLIVFGQSNLTSESTIAAVPESGGDARTLVSVKSTEGTVTQPAIVHVDGRAYLMFVYTAALQTVEFTPQSEGQIVVEPLGGGTRHALIEVGTNPHLLPDGTLLYTHDGTLFGVRFDERQLAVRGSPVPLVDGVSQTPSRAAQAAFSADGTLVYVPGSGTPRSKRILVWVDRAGGETPIPIDPRAYLYCKLSPDDRMIAVSSIDEQQDIWIWDTKQDRATRFTMDAAAELYPIWTRDGRALVFDSIDPTTGVITMFRKSADGTGMPEPLSKPSPLDGGTTSGFPHAISRDGVLLYRTVNPAAVYAMPLDGSRPGTPLLRDPNFAFENPEISPDGRWIAYQSTESGFREIYVRPYPNLNGGRWQISSGGGAKPLWSRSGDELFYMTTSTLPNAALMVTRIERGSSFSNSKPQRLFDLLRYGTGVIGRNYDVANDGRFVFIKATDPGDGPPSSPTSLSSSIVVVTHWLDDVRARMK